MKSLYLRRQQAGHNPHYICLEFTTSTQHKFKCFEILSGFCKLSQTYVLVQISYYIQYKEHLSPLSKEIIIGNRNDNKGALIHIQ